MLCISLIPSLDTLIVGIWKQTVTWTTNVSFSHMHPNPKPEPKTSAPCL